MAVVFAMGLPNSTHGSNTQKMLKRESDLYHDMIQENFSDHYHNLTLKV